MSRRLSNRQTWVMLLVLLAAFALRVYRLDGQSLWSDEGISLLRSSQPLPALLADMPVEHLPGYFVLLHGWLQLAGSQDYALRFLSLLPSVLAVALIYRLAVDLAAGTKMRTAAAWGGVIAAAWMATSVFQVWYGQEARMYSWLLASTLSATWLLWRLFYHDKQPVLNAAGYVVALTLTVYLHFYGFLLPLAHTLFAVGWLLVYRDPRRFGWWALCGLTVLLLFAPWLPRALEIAQFGGWRDPGDPGQIPWRYLTAYTVGDAMPEPLRSRLPVVYALLAAGGLVGWRRVRPAALWLLVVVTVAPLAMVLAYALRNPDFHERYAIAVSAPLLLLAAGGLSGLWAPTRHAVSRRIRWRVALPALAALLLVGANGVALQRLYTDESLHKPDFRGAAWRIAHEESPGDVVLVDGPDPEKVFLHYFRGASPVHDLRDLAGATWDQVDAVLAAATVNADDAWEVLYFHAPSTVQVWLAVNGWASAASEHNGIRVTRYGLPGPALAATELNLAVGDALTLVRAEVSASPLVADDLLRVTTDWFTHTQPRDYKFSLRLQDAAGAVLLAQDYVPQNGFAPTSVWIVGQGATDRRGILIPPELAPGVYRVTLRLYDPANGQAVETRAGQDITLGQISVQAP